MAVPGRVDQVRAQLEAAGCDALLVTKLVNVRWLTGFTGSAAMVVVLGDRLVFTTDGRYGEQSERQLAGAGVDAERTIAGGVGQRDAVVAALAGTARIGLEAETVTWAQQRRWSTEWFPESTLVPTESLVDGLRITKDDGEVARIEAACAVADAALAAVRHRLAERPTEVEFGLELDLAMRRLGAEGTSFETIVAAGPNGAMPHHRPDARPIQEGDLVVLDFGALVDGYCSDMTRTIMVGEPSEVQQRMLDVVAASQSAGVESVGPQVRTGDVDRACRAVIDEAGWGESFLHSTGHGVGLEIHEAPGVAKDGDATLPARCSGHGRAGRVPPRPWRCSHRGHGGGHRRRLSSTDVSSQDRVGGLTDRPSAALRTQTRGTPWPSPPTT